MDENSLAFSHTNSIERTLSVLQLNRIKNNNATLSRLFVADDGSRVI